MIPSVLRKSVCYKASPSSRGSAVVTILLLDFLKHLYPRSQDLISKKVRSQNKESGKLYIPSKIMLRER